MSVQSQGVFNLVSRNRSIAQWENSTPIERSLRAARVPLKSPNNSSCDRFRRWGSPPPTSRCIVERKLRFFSPLVVRSVECWSRMG